MDILLGLSILLYIFSIISAASAMVVDEEYRNFYIVFFMSLPSLIVMNISLWFHVVTEDNVKGAVVFLSIMLLFFQILLVCWVTAHTYNRGGKLSNFYLFFYKMVRFSSGNGYILLRPFTNKIVAMKVLPDTERLIKNTFSEDSSSMIYIPHEDLVKDMRRLVEFGNLLDDYITTNVVSISVACANFEMTKKFLNKGITRETLDGFYNIKSNCKKTSRLKILK